jgi:hypothetical protein
LSIQKRPLRRVNEGKEPYWHGDIGATFGAMMQDTDAFLLGRRT